MAYVGRVRIASGWIERMCGLLRRRLCRNGEALLLMPCARIHTFGMDSPIDVAFIAASGRVLCSVRSLPPNRLLSCPRAVGTLERRSGGQSAWYEADELIYLSSEVVHEKSMSELGKDGNV